MEFPEQTPEFGSDSEQSQTEAQRQALMMMGESGVPFVLWGSWAAKQQGIYPEAYQPHDVDIFTNAKDIEKMREMMEAQGFESVDDETERKISFRKGEVFVDSHIFTEEGDYLVERTPAGVFYFPKEGFFSWGSYSLITPEMMYVMESGGPFREGKPEKLAMLEKAVDPEKLKVIQAKFRYESTIESGEKQPGEADTGLKWEKILTKLTPEQAKLIEEDEYGVTDASLAKLRETGFSPVGAVDARGDGIALVDKEIRDVVMAVDQLPFAKSNNGCSGHSLEDLSHRLGKSEDQDSRWLEEIEATMLPYSSGYLAMYLDTEDPRSYAFADELLRTVEQFAAEHPDMQVSYKLNRKAGKEGVVNLAIEWRVLPPDGWRKEKTGQADLPTPQAVKQEGNAAQVIAERQLEYPFDQSKKDAQALYERIYAYRYHDFYVENQTANQKKLQEAFDQLRQLAKKWQGEAYDGQIITDAHEEVEKFESLRQAADQAKLFGASEKKSDWQTL